MISAIQPAGMVLIVKIILMLITGTCFVNGEYSQLRVASYELRVTSCGVRGTRCGALDIRYSSLVTCHLSLFFQVLDIFFIDP